MNMDDNKYGMMLYSGGHGLIEGCAKPLQSLLNPTFYYFGFREVLYSSERSVHEKTSLEQMYMSFRVSLDEIKRCGGCACAVAPH